MEYVLRNQVTSKTSINRGGQPPLYVLRMDCFNIKTSDGPTGDIVDEKDREMFVDMINTCLKRKYVAAATIILKTEASYAIHVSLCDHSQRTCGIAVFVYTQVDFKTPCCTGDIHKGCYEECKEHDADSTCPLCRSTAF